MPTKVAPAAIKTPTALLLRGNETADVKVYTVSAYLG